MSRVEIRLLKSLQEFRQCEGIQEAVWGNSAASGETLAVTQKYGGVVLGALAGGKVVGFIYAFLGQYQGRLIHWSHLMAVEAAYRDRGLGYRMKLVHRKLALERGIKWICWTYDPLQSRNATLNFARLGGEAREYLVDCYGQFPSQIEKGLPSDRFVLNWPLDSSRVKRRLREEPPKVDLSLPRVNETKIDALGFMENRKIRLGLGETRLLVEIPSNTDAMRERALPLALRWRLQARKIFGHYLSNGYIVSDFVSPSPATGNRCFYLLERRPGKR